MNKAFLIGRTTDVPKVRYSQGEKSMAIASFTIAVERRYKREGQPSTDFINCKAVGPTAAFIEKYIGKGAKIGVDGRIETGSYEKDGKKVYTTEVFCESVEFCEAKANNLVNTSASSKSDADGFMSLPTGNDDFLPFA